MEHTCNREVEIVIMQEAIKKLDTTINGNGQPGIKSDMACIKNDVGHIKEDLKGLSSGVRAMMSALDETKGEKRAETEYKLNARQKTKIWMTGVLGISSLIITILVKFIK